MYAEGKGNIPFVGRVSKQTGSDSRKIGNSAGKFRKPTPISQRASPGSRASTRIPEQKARKTGKPALFETRHHAEDYLTMHTARLESFGNTGIQGRIFDVNGPLTEMTSGPVS